MLAQCQLRQTNLGFDNQGKNAPQQVVFSIGIFLSKLNSDVSKRYCNEPLEAL
jgi:hypothetical protein